LFGLGYHYRNGLAYYFKSNKVLQQEEDKRISDVRNYQVLDKHAGKAIGLDVSEYQGKSVGLMWIRKINIPYTLFSFATVGNDRLTSNLMKIGGAKTTSFGEPIIIIVLTKIH
jgi:lysozyme